MIKDECIILDEDDNVTGHANKKVPIFNYFTYLHGYKYNSALNSHMYKREYGRETYIVKILVDVVVILLHTLR